MNSKSDLRINQNKSKQIETDKKQKQIKTNRNKYKQTERKGYMSTDWVVDMGSEALFLIIKTAAPILLVSLAVGLIVSIFQTVTSIQEQTLTFVPKILAVFLTLMLLGSWILDSISGYMIELWSNFSVYIR